MFSKPLLMMLVVSVLLEVGTHDAVGQPPNQDRAHVRSAVERIVYRGKGRAIVRMKDGTTKKGRIMRVDADSFELAENSSGRVFTVKYDDVREAKKQGMSNGAKKTAVWIGVAAGAAVLFITLPKRGIGPICPLGCGL